MSISRIWRPAIINQAEHSFDWKYKALWKLFLDTATRVQILDQTDCISHNTNTIGKGMNPIIFPPATGK